MEQDGYEIRAYRSGDRQAIRDLCVATAWMGQPAPERIANAWIWAEYWTRYFTDADSRHTWVVARAEDGGVVGYLTGTADARRVERYVPWLLPGMILRTITRRLLRRHQTRTAILGMARSALRGELDVPHWVRRDFPATLHIDLLPETRGLGLGRKLFNLYLRGMQAARVRGIHAQTLSINTPISRFNEAMGFRRVASRDFTAYAHLDGEAIQIHTWVRGL
jgi:GNAT superfamily N-acetyltransferase